MKPSLPASNCSYWVDDILGSGPWTLKQTFAYLKASGGNIPRPYLQSLILNLERSLRCMWKKTVENQVHKIFFWYCGLHGYTGTANMTAKDLQMWVNDRLKLSQEDSYSESKCLANLSIIWACFCFSGTVVNWLHLMGFKVTETKKGIYFDGHER